MDTDVLVDSRVDEGESLVARLVADGFDVAAAFWARASEDGLWCLYVASRSFDVKSSGDLYLRLYKSLAAMHSDLLDFNDIKLISADSPIAVDAIKFRERSQARIGARYEGKRLGDLSIEEAYIYPILGPMTQNDILQTVLSLINRQGPLPPTLVTLHNGSTMRVVPVGMENKSGQLNVTLHNVDTGADCAIPAGNIASMQ